MVRAGHIGRMPSEHGLEGGKGGTELISKTRMFWINIQPVLRCKNRNPSGPLRNSKEAGMAEAK